jgi:hypothetical protein
MRILISALWIMLAAMASAQTSQEQGKRIVDEALAALGGEKFLAMKDRTETGRAYSFFRERLRGLSRATVYTRYLDSAPQGTVGLRERQAFGKDEYSAVLFADGQGWEITFRGARPLPDDTIARFEDSTLRNIFYILRMRLNEPGLIIESRGSEIFDNRPVDVVDITDSENRTVTVYFQQSTKLPIYQSFVRRDPKTRDRFEEVTVYSKFRDAGGGVMWPLAIERKRNGEKVFEIYSDSVTINNNLADNLFTLPGDMKILPKAR